MNFNIGYDGCATMSGCISGVATRIREKAPKAIYVHCLAHQLHLSLEAASMRLTDVADYFNVVQHVSVFVEGSAKRHDLFAQIQKESDVERVLALKLIGATRWLTRKTAMQAIDSTYPHILAFMEVYINKSICFICLKLL
jgi:hypothetical protein